MMSDKVKRAREAALDALSNAIGDVDPRSWQASREAEKRCREAIDSLILAVGKEVRKRAVSASIAAHIGDEPCTSEIRSLPLDDMVKS